VRRDAELDERVEPVTDREPAMVARVEVEPLVFDVRRRMVHLHIPTRLQQRRQRGNISRANQQIEIAQRPQGRVGIAVGCELRAFEWDDVDARGVRLPHDLSQFGQQQPVSEMTCPVCFVELRDQRRVLDRLGVALQPRVQQWRDTLPVRGSAEISEVDRRPPRRHLILYVTGGEEQGVFDDEALGLISHARSADTVR
jgi:hypothetical protein